jgi:hypothetical protein
VRTLYTLIKKQIADDAYYLMGAILASIVLIVATISTALTGELGNPSLYTITLLITMPILICTGFYALGLHQTYNDRTSGFDTLLSVLPVKHNQILLAQLIIAILVILTALGPLAIVGAILWEFIGLPEWLFQNWVADVFIGMSLITFVCYCFGLYASQKVDSFESGLYMLPLVPIPLLLVVVKGFGWPLIMVLLPLIAAFLLCCRKLSASRYITTIATGFIVLILLCIIFSLGRFVCDLSFISKMPGEIAISPSGLLPLALEHGPNATYSSVVHARIRRATEYHDNIVGHIIHSSKVSLRLSKSFETNLHLFERLGIIEYLQSRARGNNYSRHALLVHIDEANGQLVYRRTNQRKWPKQHSGKQNKITKLSAGPKGVSRTPDKDLGRFDSPIILFEPPTTYFTPKATCIVYDRMSRCFFSIDFDNQTILRKTELKDPAIQPFEIRPLIKTNILSINITPTQFNPPLKEYMAPIRRLSIGSHPLVLDESGKIYFLNPKTLNLSEPIGYLPQPKTLFGWGPQKPRDLMAYNIVVFASNLYWSNGKYLGMAAGSVSHQGKPIALAVFDREGNRIKTAHTQATIFKAPWGPASAMIKYLFENLHPPILTLASFFTAHYSKARSTYSTLFLMPNSFVASLRDREGNIFFTFLIALLMMSPSLLFAGLLSWRVVRDAEAIGLSYNSRRLWVLGTIAFGLTAYITYKLTRPKITLVTCQNCGKPRRPDMDKCHRCKSGWHVPELTPPLWRVLNGTEQVQNSSPIDEEEITTE